MSLQNFVHLRLHTEYSLLDSVVRVPELMQAVAAAGMPAVALTDECNLFAMVKFYRAALASGLDDPARAEQRRMAGRERAAGFTWDRTAELTAAAYAEVAP